MAYECKILADSISPAGHRLTTFLVTAPRIILAEINTHRVLSRNSASSRAIPVLKSIDQVYEDPFIPVHWGRNQKGMQAGSEVEDEVQRIAHADWLQARDFAAYMAKRFAQHEIHKQVANRLVELFKWHTMVISGTEWSNFFALRAHPDAQPEFQVMARMMKDCYEANLPKKVAARAESMDPFGSVAGWHLPFVTGEEEDLVVEAWHQNVFPSYKLGELAVKVSTGRTARVSTLTHDGAREMAADVGLCDRLLIAGHMSPFEAPARPMTGAELELFKQPELVWSNDLNRFVPTGQFTHFCGNVQGWIQYRKHIKNENDFGRLQGGLERSA